MKQKNEMKMKLAKAFCAVTLFVSCFAAKGYYVYATNIGEQVGEWVLEQIFWVALIAVAVTLIGCLIKRAWVAMAITGICGGIALVFIYNPKLLADLGQTIYNTILGG